MVAQIALRLLYSHGVYCQGNYIVIILGFGKSWFFLNVSPISFFIDPSTSLFAAIKKDFSMSHLKLDELHLKKDPFCTFNRCWNWIGRPEWTIYYFRHIQSLRESYSIDWVTQKLLAQCATNVFWRKKVHFYKSPQTFIGYHHGESEHLNTAATRIIKDSVNHWVHFKSPCPLRWPIPWYII